MRSPITSLFLPLALLGWPAMATAQTDSRMRVVQDQAVVRTLETVPVTPPPVGPPPQNVGWDYSASYGPVLKVVWAAAPNAVSYVVERRMQNDATCCNATSGPLPATATSWTDTGLLKKGTYMYNISVSYADGSVGVGGFGTTGGAENPVVTATDVSAGRVRLTWDYNIRGSHSFIIRGPGLGNGAEVKEVTGGSYDTAILQPGSYTWTVATSYTNNLGVVSPPSDWGTVTHAVSYGMGRFRISLEGFKAIGVTAEDPFRSDGRGDEVYITTQVSEYGRNGQLRSTRMLRTPTFGDRQNFPDRVQAGSAGPSGGVVPGDRYPAEAQLISQLQPATTTNLPFVLWEGDLTEIDNALILSPAVWESDLGDELFPFFMTYQTGIATDLPYRNAFNPYIPNSYGRPVIDTWNPQQNCMISSRNSSAGIFQPPINGWHDEPIDMSVDHTYCPTYVAINWQLARSMTTVNPATVVEIPFKNKQTNWQYTLYVRIEKVAPPMQAVPVVAPVMRRTAAP